MVSGGGTNLQAIIDGIKDKTITNTEIAALIPKSKLTGPMILKEEGRVVLFRRELTCGYMLIADGSNDQKTLVSDLSLYQ